MNNNPLVTYCLIAYNAEAYIDEAVNSAFAQTYVPLEIIISDDCSTDETFARIEALAVAYKGPARVIINRNTTNLGIGAHVNLTFKKSSGDYFIMAAGDDISTPDRVEIIIKEFLSDPLQIKAVFSDCIVIDSLGTEQGISSATPPRQFTEPKSMCRNSFRGVTGATAAWHRDVYSIFGPMNADVTFEDRVLAFRSALLGEIRYLALPLVYYRRHETNTVGMFHVCSSEAFRKRTRCFAAVYRNAIDDLNRTYAEVHKFFTI